MTEMRAVLILLSCFFNVAHSFCGDDALHGNLAETAVQVSNWLREHHHDDVTRLEAHVTSAMVASLRLVGHLPRTIMADFKSNEFSTVADYLKSHLDKHQTQYKTLLEIKPGRLAVLSQAISALCFHPQDFHGHNLTKALLESFTSMRLHRISNFEYSSVALAVCQSLDKKITPNLARKIISEMKKFQRAQCRSNVPDGLAMSAMALSCLGRNMARNETGMLKDLNSTITRYLDSVVDALRKRKDALWNAQSKALVVQAFMSVPRALRPKHWHCKRLMSSILSKHDPGKAFGNVLANIQILPALMGRSLVDLRMSCSAHNSQEKQINKINVCIKLAFQDPLLQTIAPEHLTFTVPEKTTAYEVLQLAEKKNEAYKHVALKTSYGRMITAISGIEQDPESGHYWALYTSQSYLAPASLAPHGVDMFTPKNNTCVVFKYEKCASIAEDTIALS